MHHKFQPILLFGPGRSGTTSFYHQLTQSPYISSSKIKELRYFEFNDTVSMEDYVKHFILKKEEKFLLEASPQYFSLGEKYYKRIQQVLPNARLIIILRNPYERYLSALRHHVFKVHPGYRAKDYMKESIEAYHLALDNKPFDRMKVGLYESCYLIHLKKIFSHFKKHQILCLSFEKLTNDFPKTVERVSGFLNIPLEFDTLIERNKSIPVRSPFMQTLAQQTNLCCESFFNRHPRLHAFVKKTYFSLNHVNTDNTLALESLTIKEIQHIIKKENAGLEDFLSQQGVFLPNIKELEEFTA